jgi:hypothetical protein
VRRSWVRRSTGSPGMLRRKTVMEIQLPEWSPVRARFGLAGERRLVGYLRYHEDHHAIAAIKVPLLDRFGDPAGEYVVMDPDALLVVLGDPKLGAAAVLWRPSGGSVRVTTRTLDGERNDLLDRALPGALTAGPVVHRTGDVLDLRPDTLLPGVAWGNPEEHPIPAFGLPDTALGWETEEMPLRDGPPFIEVRVVTELDADRPWERVVVGPIYCGTRISADVTGALIRHAMLQAMVVR